MSDITFQIIFIILLTIANGIFSMSEIAIISARKARLQQWVNEGNTKAQAALDLADSPNRLLSTVQIGITLIGILAGVLGGATIADELSARLIFIPLLAPYSEAIALGIVVLGITYLTLVIGELVPKRIALHNPERIACTVAAPMRMLSRIASPAVHLLSISTDTVLRVLGIRPVSEQPVTEEEINILIEQGMKAGTFEEAERDMVEHVFRLGDLRAGALMTPRTEIVWLDIDDSPEETRRRIADSGHSRFPVGQGSLDNILGIVQIKDMLGRNMEGKSPDLKASLRRPLFVPESTHALKVLELFKQSGIHISLVVDEYGSVQGLVTLKDILEEIVGDIPSVEDLEEPLAVQREDGSWLLDGMLLVDDFKEIFSIKELPGEGIYQTLGGFVLMHMGRIPAVGNHFEWSGLRFEVVDMDKNRIDKVLVMPARKAPPAQQTKQTK
ncbi:MAG: putative hemolysin [Candidatus Methanoperedens nitroreducens]|uniref:Putative hemolysin n=1 Tax=Candidatus Methanoperedens nitratireducens TaxID=1392998 RepID=A0A0P7ZDB7_9EURY|nr:hemolysin family protein [Candidatus Methanoperedens sp. BLZ2]KAB2945629.1 MAG: HlyC/CorC family transporter [Candidatus Methanoperedens sp.]KPQ42663.1 MAG: putative hemolysin [Candidatus Methanoperedens sp. BLZ1]MCX9076866.1 hemolysin family protein [Candidatus Methanoperedens sp.]